MIKLYVIIAVLSTVLIAFVLNSCNYAFSYKTGDNVNLFISPPK